MTWTGVATKVGESRALDGGREPAVLAVAFAVLSLATAAAAEEPPRADPTTADEVIARYVEAHGGLAAWDALESLEIRGTYTAFSEEAPFVLYRRRPAAYRFETHMLGSDVVEAFDGEGGAAEDGGWMLNPLTGIDWPVAMKPAEVAAAWTAAEFDSPLVRWREKGHAVELAGRDDLDGQAVWRLEVTRKDGAQETWFLDAATYLEAGRVAPVADFGSPFTQKIYYSDFRPVQGVLLPHHLEAEYFIRYQITQIEEVRVNPDLDPALFARPVAPERSRLDALAGEWTVQVETRPHPRAPWQAAETSSSITALAGSGGGVLQERIVYTVDGRPVDAVRLYSWDRFNGQYRLVTTDDFTGHLNVFTGTAGDDGTITFSNAATGTAWKTTEGAVTERYLLHDLTVDGFKVDLEQSTDGGETWTPAVRFTYKRRP